eukprot:6175006-Pleurochrysis_carterae.AAC.2
MGERQPRRALVKKRRLATQGRVFSIRKQAWRAVQERRAWVRARVRDRSAGVVARRIDEATTASRSLHRSGYERTGRRAAHAPVIQRMEDWIRQCSNTRGAPARARRMSPCHPDETEHGAAHVNTQPQVEESEASAAACACSVRGQRARAHVRMRSTAQARGHGHGQTRARVRHRPSSCAQVLQHATRARSLAHAASVCMPSRSAHQKLKQRRKETTC